MSEDLPQLDSRVEIRSDGAIQLNWRRSNLHAHAKFVNVAKRVLKDAGFPIVLSKPFGTDTPSHQCGTTRFGTDPASSVLDTHCRSWDHENLFVVDAGFMPSSAALNPALTIAAQSLRAAQHIESQLHTF
jgi:choline dehydrogenase-like flavoprotein